MLSKSNPIANSKTLVAASVAAAFGLSAGAVLAQTSTPPTARDVAAANSITARHVTLTNQQSEQTLRYSSARNLRICNLSGRSESAVAQENAADQRAPEDFRTPALRAGAAGPATPVPLQLSYAGNSEQIQPGNCYDFRARDVRLSPARTLPAGSALTVAISPMSANGFVNGRTVAYSSTTHESDHWRHDGYDKESVEDLKAQLKRDDEQERQADAELMRARDRLARTTRDLKKAESQERHVASTERQTQRAEQHAQQQTDQSRQNDGTPR